MKPYIPTLVVVFGIAVAVVRLDGARGDESSPRTSDIEEFLPDELRGKFQPDLPGVENSRKVLLAMVGLVQMPADSRQAYRLSSMAAGNMELPPVEERGWLADIIRKNESALVRLDDVLEHSYLRLAADDDAHSVRTQIRDFHDIRRIQTRLLVEAGDFPSVIERVRGDLRLGKLLTAPPADYVMYPIGLRIQDSSLAILEQAARQRDIPTEVLREFVDLALSAGEHPDALPFVLRGQFESLVKPQLQRLLPDGNAAAVVGLWLDRMRPSKPLPFENFDLDAELGKRQQQIEAILAGHPHPYDREETIRIVVDRFARALREPYKWDPAWTPTLTPTDKELACWPDELSLHSLDLISLPVGNEQPVLDSTELQAARECLREIENPLGRHLAAEMSIFPATISHASLTAWIRLRASALAVRLFHDSKGRLPGSLEEVVDAGILPYIPRDPFGGDIQYAAQRKFVWSVWTNGVNDNGESEPGESFALLRKMRLPESRKLPAPPPPLESPADDRVRAIPLPSTGGSQ